MTAPLSTCTPIEQRGVVHFLWANLEAKDIHKELLPMYGEHCLSCQAIHNWVQKFSEGRTSIEDEHRAGRPVEIATPETLQHVEDIIRAERRDLAPRDFHLFGPLKHHLSGERFPDSSMGHV